MKYLTIKELKAIAEKHNAKLTLSSNYAKLSWPIGEYHIGFSNNGISANPLESVGTRYSDFHTFYDIPEGLYDSFEKEIERLNLDQVQEELNDIPHVLIVIDEGVTSSIRSNGPVKAQVVEFDEGCGYPSIEEDYWDDKSNYQIADLYETIEEMEEEYKNRWDRHLISLKSNLMPDHN